MKKEEQMDPAICNRSCHAYSKLSSEEKSLNISILLICMGICMGICEELSV